MQTYILYTISKIETYQDRANLVAKNWGETKGRDKIQIILKQVKPKKPLVTLDQDGDKVINWQWFALNYPKGDYDGVIYQFTPYYRKKWGISENINGARDALQRQYPQFWVCCDAKAMAKGYKDLSEFERLLYHEHAHYDEDVDDMVGDKLTQDSVHTVDYKLKQIDKYHLLVDYRGQAIKQGVMRVTNAIIKLAKQYI